jgi:hypothetical protein
VYVFILFTKTDGKIGPTTVSLSLSLLLSLSCRLLGMPVERGEDVPAWAQGPDWRNPGSYVGSLIRETADERDRRLARERYVCILSFL